MPAEEIVVDLREALYTTRAMRRVKPDPIPVDVQARILDAAIRAPSGGNSQNWRFLLVDDPGVKEAVAVIYRDCLARVWHTHYASRIAAAAAEPDSAESRRFVRMKASAEHLAEHFGEVPLLLLAFVQHDTSGGSIFPAVWSAMLAARGEGVGTALTSAMVLRADDVLEVLGVPPGEGWKLAACVTLGYPTGRWGVAERRPAHEVSFRNRWGVPLDFEIPGPLWP
jgi:nitroreductase